eukprot:CAMPEP_0195510386 /NCGR_PEP_ID=MMETSP0794_2-20130614/3042_1 /TAXON_ID=515487 /ORGANISM="Stephanopyxis turris, Strain CCMP 815" /LENGTH=88 /DNA_ID=CAMNT_0040637795 /DNA_START=598 /DNA_END=864 /DNA_ORIENTATION=+
MSFPSFGSFPSSLSSSANSDTVPEFRAASGLLSPETVERLNNISDGSCSALQFFLDTYRENGPMACLPLLSDPTVLPQLTKALKATMA